MKPETLPVGTLEAILAANEARASKATKPEPVEVPEWGCSVTIKALTRGDIKNLPDDGIEISVAMLTGFVVDPKITEEAARQLVAEDRPIDRGANRVLDRISEVSGIRDTFRP